MDLRAVSKILTLHSQQVRKSSPLKCILESGHFQTHGSAQIVLLRSLLDKSYQQQLLLVLVTSQSYWLYLCPVTSPILKT